MENVIVRRIIVWATGGEIDDDITRPVDRDTEEAKSGVALMAQCARLDPEADLPSAIRDLALGKLDEAAFLERFGHRGPREMELSEPRWPPHASQLFFDSISSSFEETRLRVFARLNNPPADSFCDRLDQFFQ